MSKPNTLQKFIITTAFVLIGASFTLIHGQSNAEQSYEATLHVLIGSDDTAQPIELPKSLDGVARQIRDNFNFKNYRLMNTYYGRLANNGSLDYKSVSSLKNGSTEPDAPTFLDWQLAIFAAEPGAGRSSFSMQIFRLGARVPVKVTPIPSADGKTNAITNYESVGLTLNKLRIGENAPTLVGTISLPRTTGTILLVLTIRPV